MAVACLNDHAPLSPTFDPARPSSVTLDGINGQSFPVAASINVFHLQVRKFLPNAPIMGFVGI
jgi:hypothetical protein